MARAALWRPLRPDMRLTRARDGTMGSPIRNRAFPIIAGGGVWSRVHIDAAAAARLAAVGHGPRGMYNIVADDRARSIARATTNEKAKRGLGWGRRYRSWRQEFAWALRSVGRVRHESDGRGRRLTARLVSGDSRRRGPERTASTPGAPRDLSRRDW